MEFGVFVVGANADGHTVCSSYVFLNNYVSFILKLLLAWTVILITAQYHAIPIQEMVNPFLRGNLTMYKWILKILAIKVLIWSSVIAADIYVQGDYSWIVKIIPTLFEEAILNLNHTQEVVTFKTTSVWLRRT